MTCKAHNAYMTSETTPIQRPAWLPTIETITERIEIAHTASELGLDIVRLEHYRLAVQAGFYTDEV